MTNFGFGPQASNKKEIKTVKELKQFLNEEIRNTEEFEQLLHQELDSLETMQANMRLIVEQLEQVRKLHTERQRLVQLFLAETKAHQVRVTESKKLLEMIEHVSQQLFPLINTIHKELSRFVLNPSHKLYKKSKNRKTIKELDKTARNLMAEVELLNEQITSSHRLVQEAAKKVQGVEMEREGKAKQTGKLGF